VDEKLRYAAANSESADCTLIEGTSASGGNSLRTWFTFAVMSARALVAS